MKINKFQIDGRKLTIQEHSFTYKLKMLSIPYVAMPEVVNLLENLAQKTKIPNLEASRRIQTSVKITDILLKITYCTSYMKASGKLCYLRTLEHVKSPSMACHSSLRN